jgi:peptidyl-prolyl cis-trans isomerase D
MTALVEIFKAAHGASGSADGASPGERILFQVTEIKTPQFNADSDEIKRIDEALRARATEDIIAQYVARLESDVGVKINQAAVDSITRGSSTQN